MRFLTVVFLELNDFRNGGKKNIFINKRSCENYFFFNLFLKNSRGEQNFKKKTTFAVIFYV